MKGAKLKAYRDQMGLSQQDAATLHRVSLSFWQKMEYDLRQVPEKTRRRIARHMKKNTDKNTDQQKPPEFCAV